MNNINYFEDLFESIPDYRKVGLLIFFFQNDEDFLGEIGLSKRNINRLNLEFKNIILEQREHYLDFVENEEESVNERFLKN